MGKIEIHVKHCHVVWEINLNVEGEWIDNNWELVRKCVYHANNLTLTSKCFIIGVLKSPSEMEDYGLINVSNNKGQGSYALRLSKEDLLGTNCVINLRPVGLSGSAKISVNAVNMLVEGDITWESLVHPITERHFCKQDDRLYLNLP
uniref:Uncharacterized protein n=1 Tax=Beihai dimarhabodovirus 1 TaxID=2116357 RepID=A0A2P1GMQ4_9RHAB|nr:hypothetical protein [Beihai dimarhabodovirus 1]